MFIGGPRVTARLVGLTVPGKKAEEQGERRSGKPGKISPHRGARDRALRRTNTGRHEAVDGVVVRRRAVRRVVVCCGERGRRQWRDLRHGRKPAHKGCGRAKRHFPGGLGHLTSDDGVVLRDGGEQARVGVERDRLEQVVGRDRRRDVGGFLGLRGVAHDGDRGRQLRGCCVREQVRVGEHGRDVQVLGAEHRREDPHPAVDGRAAAGLQRPRGTDRHGRAHSGRGGSGRDRGGLKQPAGRGGHCHGGGHERAGPPRRQRRRDAVARGRRHARRRDRRGHGYSAGRAA